MSNTLANRVTLVTGGAQGLGQAICWRLAQEGCHVAVADINEQARRCGTGPRKPRTAIAVRWM